MKQILKDLKELEKEIIRLKEKEEKYPAWKGKLRGIKDTVESVDYAMEVLFQTVYDVWVRKKDYQTWVRIKKLLNIEDMGN